MRLLLKLLARENLLCDVKYGSPVLVNPMGNILVRNYAYLFLGSSALNQRLNYFFFPDANFKFGYVPGDYVNRRLHSLRVEDPNFTLYMVLAAKMVMMWSVLDLASQGKGADLNSLKRYPLLEEFYYYFIMSGSTCEAGGDLMDFLLYEVGQPELHPNLEVD